jgi:hypothetical protein
MKAFNKSICKACAAWRVESNCFEITHSGSNIASNIDVT